MSLGSEVADLAIFLCIVCVPIAVAAVFIPVGRALADRIRGDQALREHQEALLRALQAVHTRLDVIDDATASNAAALERLAARRLPELQQRPSNTPRPTTPH